ncbi:unnamed protein product [Cochlearia groenlandica]
MGEEAEALDIENTTTTRRNDLVHKSKIDLYPLNSYYFGSRDAIRVKDELISDRIIRLKSNYDARGLRNSVEAILLVELFKHPHVMILQYRNSIYKLPGGRLRLGESDTEGLKRKLASKLSIFVPDLEVGECIGMWWRSNFETLMMYPFLPPNVKHPKECTKLFLVRLPENQQFVVPKNFRLLAVPLSQIHENEKTYGPIISQIPKLLSRFSFNMIEI